ncbi:hypothetical protein [Tolypothrix sp. NIES-4075]|uniref:hypothetical protein n=1 Tax=Tolypothrix sp. NIES-4075 TaxID=2005459 RepID=UPI001359C5D0|nr:hypothetical protein [Tolypothrix sp. NIES-4075]
MKLNLATCICVDIPKAFLKLADSTPQHGMRSLVGSMEGIIPRISRLDPDVRVS